MRSKAEIFRRYLFLAVGLLINAAGIVLITKACMGNSPIGSIPYILSLKFPYSLGALTFALYFLMFIIQLFILGKNIKAKDFIQLPLSVVYSCFIDLCMYVVRSFTPSNYGIMMSAFLFGCVLRAFGVSVQVIADVAMLPGEAFMIAVSKALKKEFSIVKLFMDGLFVAIAAGLSIVFFGKLIGIREGTLIAVIITAPMSKIFSLNLIPFENNVLIGAKTFKSAFEKTGNDDEPYIITISSQSGSGGHKIAKILAKRLGLPLYDNNLIDIISKEGNFPEGYVKKRMERLYTNRFWEFYVENYSYVGYSLESYEPLFNQQTKVINDIASRGSSIIVGYCSEYLLRNRKNVISIYIHANEERKLEFLEQEYKVNSKEALGIMKSHDRERALYFKHFTGEEWAISDRFSVTIDSSILGIEETGNLLYDVIKKIQKA